MANAPYRVEADFQRPSAFENLIRKLDSAELRTAAARGLSEHADEQKRQSAVRISSYTGVPKSRFNRVTKVIRASASDLTATVRTADSAIMLGEYGNPEWDRSMPGAVATGWNVRRTFRHSFMIGGKLFVRKSKSRTPLKPLSMAVLASELANPNRPNTAGAEALAALDLEKRVTRHVLLTLGT